MKVNGYDIKPDADLRIADLSGADLGYANLRDADLRGADLRDAYLGYANLRDADLRGANLSGANLRNADLSGACVGYAALRNADLSGADLSGADLRIANLSGADLRGAKYKGITITKPIIQLYLNPFYITIIGKYVRVGCKEYTIKQWLKFSEKKIAKLDHRNISLAFYKKYKDILVQLAEVCQ